MRPLPLFALLTFASTLSLGSLGCSSSSGTTDNTTDSGPRDTGSQLVDSSPTDTAPVDTGPAVCWVVKSARPGCDECYRNQCKNEAIAAYGPNWTNGNFAGACADFATCNCKCAENDLFCQQGCGVSSMPQACSDAQKALKNCVTTNCQANCPSM